MREERAQPFLFPSQERPQASAVDKRASLNTAGYFGRSKSQMRGAMPRLMKVEDEGATLLNKRPAHTKMLKGVDSLSTLNYM